ncbi:NAD-dependent epimerase/dehydratase family protein [Niabella sp. CC-SYL272]|uniref:NAD-dependent epimerase/dehydratase family protein n=1 Tax=Niabella agricola TaxID=2891571 RepID=UPI001F3E55AD|nr:NAD-dependent epimerase/dehydratase family protein [Niabella agricola]MCF3107512.1 NAD-dependent epimerase/dehydratase family protein [Niabella agricola]
MNLLLTGASGFLGKNIRPILAKHYNVKSLGRGPSNDFIADITSEVPALSEKFNIIIHAAGKAHTTPKNDQEKQLFFDVNLNGTKNLCSSLEKAGIPEQFIFISTVAVYGLDEGTNITEQHSLNGGSPYALSKRKAEEFLTGWCKEHGVILTILRPSLIAGPDAPGNLGAMVQGIRSGKYLSIAGGKARKSILMVEDIAHLIPLVADKGGIYNICDDTHPSFRQLELLTSKQLGKKPPTSIPLWIARLMAMAGNLLGAGAPINSRKLKKITGSLTFSNEKAKQTLGWTPTDVLKNYQI